VSPWRSLCALLLGSVLCGPALAVPVVVHSDDVGHQLLVDGEPLWVKGMNWGYMPIGENYTYDFWGHDDDFIVTALTEDMGLLEAMGVNVIRQYDVIPPRWVTWIHDNYGIYTVINPLVGRYGATIDGSWRSSTDYSDSRTREVLVEQTLVSVERYKHTEGVLFYLLGNENNYGLHWSSFEIENLPGEARHEAKARHLYSLYGEIIRASHAADPDHPVAIANGEVQYLDLIAELCPELDIFAANIYRGADVRDLYQVVEETLGLPFVYSEFGADAYNARTQQEDHLAQAGYLDAQWEDMYANAHGNGGVGNVIGGMVFQWSDGWWKTGQTDNLFVHDTNATWATGAYPHDHVAGANNMNEEWFGIAAKAPSRPDGTVPVVPRSAYYLLQAAWRLDPYAPETDAAAIAAHFDSFQAQDFDTAYLGAMAASDVTQLKRAQVDDVQLQLTGVVAGSQGLDDRPRGRTADHTESILLDFGGEPVPGLTTDVAIHVLGHVAENRIDTISYEQRGRELQTASADGEEVDLAALERVRIYRAAATWQHPWFQLDAYYRAGHTHWAGEGDFFGLYREAYYGPAIDTYSADAPIGLELAGKRQLSGLKLAIGPQVYWGANPTAIAKYSHALGRSTVTVMHQEDLAPQAALDSTRAVPEPVTRRTTLHLTRAFGGLLLDAGGIMAGSNKLGEGYRMVVEAEPGETTYADSGFHVLDDQIRFADTLGGKVKLTAQMGRFQAYAQGVYQGLVADGGPDPTVTWTGWSLKNTGRGNQVGGTAGVVVNLGQLQIAPNLLVQKPLVGPLPALGGSYDTSTGWYVGSVAPRNIRDDPFAVLDNRETYAVELLLVWDPTPGTWYWMWDNLQREDARLALSLDLVYRIQPTSRDASLAINEEGYLFAFGTAPPAQNVWDATLRWVSNPGHSLHLFGHGYVGQAQANGDSERLVTRAGGDVTLWWETLAATARVKWNDWGPYDYHRDYNLTFPWQVSGELAYGTSVPRLALGRTQLALFGTWRQLDQHSPDFVTPLNDPDARGHEWETGLTFRVGL
jgi:beta-galactosidase